MRGGGGVPASTQSAEAVAFLISKAQFQSAKVNAAATTWRQSPWVEAAGRRGRRIR